MKQGSTRRIAAFAAAGVAAFHAVSDGSSYGASGNLGSNAGTSYYPTYLASGGQYKTLVVDSDNFAKLAADYISRTAFISSPRAMMSIPEFTSIVNIGQSALGDIFSLLDQSPHSWFPVLAAITGESPINPTSRGNTSEMVKDWHDWRAARGIG